VDRWSECVDQVSGRSLKNLNFYGKITEFKLGPNGRRYICLSLRKLSERNRRKFTPLHGIQWRGQDFDKKIVFQEVHSKEADKRIS